MSIDKSILTANIKECQTEGILPQMPPDLFDDFITWLYERVDLFSFQQSKIEYKMKMYRQFVKSQPPSKLQYVMTFTHYERPKHGITSNKKG